MGREKFFLTPNTLRNAIRQLRKDDIVGWREKTSQEDNEDLDIQREKFVMERGAKRWRKRAKETQAMLFGRYFKLPGRWLVKL